jgi:hypothetical protein
MKVGNDQKPGKSEGVSREELDKFQREDAKRHAPPETKLNQKKLAQPERSTTGWTPKAKR